MRARLYWLTAAVLLALAVHLAAVIFPPRSAMSRIMRAIKPLGGENALRVLAAGEAARYLNETVPDFRIAACVFDVKRGPVAIHTVVPDRDWAIELFASDGTSIYALDSGTAEPGPIDILLQQRQRTSIFDPAAPAARNDNVSRITVETTRDTGLALIRTQVPSPAYASRVEEEFAQSFCRESDQRS